LLYTLYSGSFSMDLQNYLADKKVAVEQALGSIIAPESA